jgi:carboxylate-amine ligase
MLGVPLPEWGYMPLAGIDVVRGADGGLRVQEDILRTPSGLAYASAARNAADGHLPVSPPPGRRSLTEAYEAIGAALRAAAPDGRGDPSIVLLSDGPSNSAWYEHRTLARRLGIPLVMPGDLHVRSGKLRAFLAAGSREVEVVYRRTDEDRLREESGEPTWLADLLLDPCRSGQVACVNAFGTGVADDKLLHAYVDDMIRFYLGEEPPVESVRTYDLGEPETRDLALSRVGELVVKPRDGHGGHGIFIGAHATAEDRAAIARRLAARPDGWVAQETVLLSRHPIVQDGALVPRHVDLRAFVINANDEISVAPGGLTRFGGEDGSLVVNSSQGGGGKDTWVLR